MGLVELIEMNIKIVKIGGKVIDDPILLNEFIHGFASISGPKILVHGGGKKAAELSEQLQIPVQMKNGRRITDRATLDVVVMVYAGLLNKQIVAALQAQGTNAAGFCGADLDLIRSVKRLPEPIDFGWVGDVSSVSVSVNPLIQLLEAGIVPVFSAITHDGAGNLLNTNADAVASVLTRALVANHQPSLDLCFEGEGVLDVNKISLSSITTSEFESMKESGAVNSGMIAKLEEGFKASLAGAVVRVCSFKAIADPERVNQGTRLV